MPDAFENFNMAIRSVLTPNTIMDDMDLYISFNDLTPVNMDNVDNMDNMDLSPYNSNSSSNDMVDVSPMSSSIVSPLDYVYSNTVTLLGEPYISVLVQPVEKFRFRYISEMIGTHGTLVGSGRRRNKSNVPTVQLHDFTENAIIRCTLVTSDEENRLPHAHRLVRRKNNTDSDDPHDIEVSQENNFIAEFSSMGIIHTARKFVKDEIIRKLRFKALEKRKHVNPNAILSVRDEAQIKFDAEVYQKSMNLNSVTLCFQGFIKDGNILKPITNPVYSNPINNLKSALTGELKICRIDKYTSSCEGGEEVFMLVEKVSKKNLRIKFFELNDDNVEIWSDYGRFSELDVHHQFAVVFRTPPYKDLTITSPKEVFIRLERPSDLDSSDALQFTYKPSDRISRKRTRVSYSNSEELTQVAVNNIPTPVTNMSTGNESFEMPREIKKILEERCPSAEFQDFVANISVELDLYEKFLQNSEELTVDGAPTRKDEKSFAKDVVADTMKKVKVEPNKAKDIIMNALKDRTSYGDSPLHCALRHGQKDTAKHLLMLMSILQSDAKEVVNIQNSSGKTPLHYAATLDEPEIAKALLMLNADTNAVDHYGQMPLHRAVRFPEAKECVDVLLSDKKINLEANTDSGWAPLLLAAQAGSCYAVRALLKAGADVHNTEMSHGRTALHLAVEGSHKDIVEYLLKNTKINVNKRNYSGNTALHAAVVTPGAIAKELCDLLLEYGADPYLRNYNREHNENKIMDETLDIKSEADDNEADKEEYIGQSSFDLASNNPEILQFVSNKLLDESIGYKKEEQVANEEKDWLDADQEKQLATILTETNGWKKLAQYLSIDYLLESVEHPYNATLLLLSYICIQTNFTLDQLRALLYDLALEDAAAYLSQILSLRET
ncbi:nuclear factor NF-kappa-B p110 subunit isoform X2 [Linepithema humile]|uniref:nuclear factor NF-kappa-B p110 subunit isoform X2 n=1 Tax=Linepithema humile TaxID=83485 RepID=UPI0006232F20|nr:PREDICTED: nuclear factor NF-kappa-B p100 subunit isoform X1 [Linepithema humile]